MTHGITSTDNMAYVGETPWHGMGNKLEPDADMATWLEASNMAYRIRRAHVRYATAHGQDAADWRVVNNQFVLLRDDNGAALGIVSDRYHVVQPSEVLSFFHDVADAQGLQLETAGTLFGGKQYWALAKAADSFTVGERDTVNRYMLLSSSADGSMATEARNTSIRVVCNNTLSLARIEDKAKVRVKHSTKFDANYVRAQMGIGQQSFATLREQAMRLADTRMDEVRALMATVQLVHPDFTKMERKAQDKAARSRPVQGILANYMGAGKGARMDGVAGTAWGWLNAVTEYTDYASRAHTPENRLDSAWFGKGDALKQTALEMAMEYASADGGKVTAYAPAPASYGLLDSVLAATA
jgi:phage/plasmid-like protein (TIGR03299 family)